MRTKLSVLLVVLAFGLSGAVLAAGQQDQPKKKVKPNPLHVKVTTQMPGVIVQFGAAAKPLAVGDRVEKGQVLVHFDDRLARLDLDAARARLAAAQAEITAANALAQEAQRRQETAEKLYAQGAMSREDKDAAVLTHAKYAGEVQVKNAAAKTAAIDVDRASLIVEFHQLRSPVNGTVRAIYRMRGEGAKALDAILLIEETPPPKE